MRWGLIIMVSSPHGLVEFVSEELKEFSFPAVLKSQVLVGGRGKAGGIKFADDLEEARAAIKELLTMKIKDLPVKLVLVEPKSEIVKELYVGFVVDRAARRNVLILSSQGGVDIEDVAKITPKKIIKMVIDPNTGLEPYQVRGLVKKIGLSGKEVVMVAGIATKLYRAFLKVNLGL